MRRFQIIDKDAPSFEGKPEPQHVAASGVVFGDGLVAMSVKDVGPACALFASFDEAMRECGVARGTKYAIEWDGHRIYWLDSDDAPLLGYPDGLEEAAVMADREYAERGSGFMARFADELRLAAKEARQ